MSDAVVKAALVSGLVVFGAGSADASPSDGKAFAEANCARCHAIGRVGESPLAEAPPFRDLHTRYPIESLAEAFAEGIVTGHPEMPEFELDARQIDAILAYMKSLSP
ncbi:MAG: cytochrome c [Pseudomonadota bacterium]